MADAPDHQAAGGRTGQGLRAVLPAEAAHATLPPQLPLLHDVRGARLNSSLSTLSMSDDVNRLAESAEMVD